MNKEHIKSVVLAVLVISNLFLGSKILMTEKLWPDGYNFFVSARKSSIYLSISKLFKGSSVNNESKSHISAPDGVIINTGYQTTRFSLKISDDMYNNVYSVCSSLLTEALSVPSKSWSYTNSEEWYSSLSGKSVYMSYSSKFDSALFARFSGCKDSEIPMLLSDVDGVVISAGAKPSVYLKGGDTYIKCSIETSVTKLEDIIDYFQQNFDDTDANSSIINYSFELLFDKPSENQHAILESMIPIYSNPIEYYPVNAENPIQKNDGTVNINTVNRILSSFEINPGTVRRYTEAGGTMVFVENNGTLKIHTNGLIEYTANIGARGIRLTDSGSAYNTICAAADFMDNINDAASADKTMIIRSDLSGNNPDNLNMTFDYAVDGLYVNISSPDIAHAVEITAENGYLKSYRHLLREYDKQQQPEQIPLYIEALDKIISENPNEIHTYIKKMYISYSDDNQNGIKYADWQFEKGVN